LVFDSSDHTKFSRHIIIPGIHVENHMEAKAFADEMVKYLDEKLHPVVDLGGHLQEPSELLPVQQQEGWQPQGQGLQVGHFQGLQ